MKGSVRRIFEGFYLFLISRMTKHADAEAGFSDASASGFFVRGRSKISKLRSAACARESVASTEVTKVKGRKL
jgi:hypothetical protein